MKTGAMFANLIKYKDPDFYKKHPCMYLFTPQQNYRLDLFAGLVVEADDDIYFDDVTTDLLERCVSRSTFTAPISIISPPRWIGSLLNTEDLELIA